MSEIREIKESKWNRANRWKMLKHSLSKLKQCLTKFGLLAALILYTGLGALVFQKLERAPDLQTKEGLKQELHEGKNNFSRTVLECLETENCDLNRTYWKALQAYDQILEKITSEGLSPMKLQSNGKPGWSYVQSAFFASTVLTTIGYGNVAPKTYWGRMFCIAFALFGIPLTLTVIANLGKLMATAVSSAYKSCHRRFPGPAFKSSLKSSKLNGKGTTVLVAILSLLLYISAGGYIFTFWESWSFFDSFYFCFITMTTVGFGDMVPTDESTYLLMCMIYILVGLALTSTAIELVRIQYTSSWKKVQALSSRFQTLALVPLAMSMKKYGEEMDVSVRQEYEDLKKTLAQGMKRDGGMWKKLLQNVDKLQIDVAECEEQRALQITIYETSV